MIKSEKDIQIFNKENISLFHELDKKYLNDEIDVREWVSEYTILMSSISPSEEFFILPETVLINNYDEELLREILSTEHVEALRKYINNQVQYWYWVQTMFSNSLCCFSITKDRTAEEINTLIDILVSVSYPIKWEGTSKYHRVWNNRDELKREMLIELLVKSEDKQHVTDRTDVYPKHLIDMYKEQIQVNLIVYLDREDILQVFHKIEKYIEEE